MNGLKLSRAGVRPARYHVTESGAILVQYGPYRAGWGWFWWTRGLEALYGVHAC